MLFLFGGTGIGEEVELVDLKLTPYEARPNLVPNHSFEDVRPDGLPEGWVWDRRNTDATCVVDDTVSHSGRRSLRFTNGTPFGAHVYGTLWVSEPIRLKPGRPYTLSAYVRSDDPGIAWVGGGHNWRIRLHLPKSPGGWRRIWTSFTASEEEELFTLRVVTESPTDGFWLDDLKLEEGEVPTIAPPVDDRWLLEPPEPEAEVEGDGPFAIRLDLWAPEEAPDLTLTASLSRPPLNISRRISLRRGAWRVEIAGKSLGADDRPRRLTVRLSRGGEEIARAEVELRFLSTANAGSRLEVIRRKLPELRRMMESVEERGQDISYPLVTYTVIENFVNYAEEDLEKGFVRRALSQIADMESMADRLERELREALEGRRRFPEVPRWTGKERPRIDGPSFIGPTVTPSDPKPVPRPIFFVGYGHFGQVRRDVEKFPRYGVNIIQIEFGPNSVFPKEGIVSDAPIRETLKVLDRAAEAGVAVNLLISPHYFPLSLIHI